MKYREFVGPVLAEELSRRLPQCPAGSDWRQLPDGTFVLVGTEFVWAATDSKPNACSVDLGGDVPFVLWKGGAQ